MAKRISEFPEIVVPSGPEEVPVAFEGRTYRIKLGNIAGLIPLPTKAQIGLGNVDNTSDLAKPVSQATQTALNAKANQVHTHSENEVVGLSSSLTGLSGQIIGALDQLQTLSIQVSGLNSTLNNQITRMDLVEDKVDALEVASNTQANTIATMNVSLSGFNTRITTNADNIQLLSDDVLTLSSRMASAESSVTSLQASNAALITDVGTINNTLIAVNTELGNHESRIDILEEAIIGDTPTVILAQAAW
jgi:chromosome segregation ATPase